MLPGHHTIYNIHALKHITKAVDEPLAKLGIGDGESLESINNLIQYPKNILKPVIEPVLAHGSYELTQIDGFSDPLTDDMFKLGTGIGDPIGGWGY